MDDDEYNCDGESEDVVELSSEDELVSDDNIEDAAPVDTGEIAKTLKHLEQAFSGVSHLPMFIEYMQFCAETCW